MQEASTARVAAVTATHHPSPGMLERLAAALPGDVLLVLVDNGSDASEVASLQALVAKRPQTLLVRNQANTGLASALNQGAHHVAVTEPARDFLLLLDQDSEPHPGSIEQLLGSFLRLEEAGEAVGCVGPRLLDRDTGMQHGFHCMVPWRWYRQFPARGSTTPISCANLNGSGTLVRTGFFLRMGGLEESFFIDHVDTEWAFRVLAAGHALFGIPQAVFDHGMGERGWRIWCFGWRVWPQRSPARHYYLFRNATRLLRRACVPRTWKAWAVVKLFLTIALHGLFDRRRAAQVRNMVRGTWDGWRAERGRPRQLPGQEHATLQDRWSKGVLQRVGACPACMEPGTGHDTMVARDHRGDMAADQWLMRRCSGCRSLYLDPRPDAESLAAAYDAYYTHVDDREVVPTRGAGRVLWGLIHGYLDFRFGLSRRPSHRAGRLVFALLPPWRLKLDYYGRHLFAAAYPNRGKLLDVGCGNGSFVARAAAMGWSAAGVDPDPKAVAVCRHQGLEVYEGTIAELPRSLDGTFDVVTLSHSIEHVADTGETLRSVAALLRQGGTLWMALPNPQGIGARFYRGAWRELHPPYHLCIPSQGQLARLLRASGFEDVSFLRRGAHAGRMMRESAENARETGIPYMGAKAAMAPVLRVLADIMATLAPGHGEETVLMATRKARR